MNAWIDTLMPHLIIVPVVLPLASAALLLLMRESNRSAKALVDAVSCAAGLAVAIALLAWVERHGRDGGGVGVYLASNWPAPFGITLAVDRLSALMLVLTSVLALGAAVFASARWHRAGVHFHTLLQAEILGVNGAFLTADLFNLFVFFEILLAASYGLLLHGTGPRRVGAGLRYIALNLLASSLFLVGVAVVYGIAGTLNYADIVQKLALVPAGDRGLLHAGAAILAIALLAKAAMWPVNFWLAPAYEAASAPVAAMFVILTKVGIYTVLRLWTLLKAGDTETTMAFAAHALVIGGLATLTFGAVGVLASQVLRKMAGYAVIMSSGTLIAAIGFGQPALVGAALYYLIGSTLAASALFLLVELIERSRDADHAPAPVDDAADHLPFYLDVHRDGTPAHPQAGDMPVIAGRPIPVALAFLGLSFIVCALMIAGMPPLSGFLGKFAIMSALLDGDGAATLASNAALPSTRVAFLVLLLAAGLATMIAMSRSGIRHFWAPQGRPAPHLRLVEGAPIAALLAAAAALAICAGPVLEFTVAAATDVAAPARYIEALLTAAPVAPPLDSTPTSWTPP